MRRLLCGAFLLLPLCCMASGGNSGLSTGVIVVICAYFTIMLNLASWLVGGFFNSLLALIIMVLCLVIDTGWLLLWINGCIRHPQVRLMASDWYVLLAIIFMITADVLIINKIRKFRKKHKA